MPRPSELLRNELLPAVQLDVDEPDFEQNCHAFRLAENFLSEAGGPTPAAIDDLRALLNRTLDLYEAIACVERTLRRGDDPVSRDLRPVVRRALVGLEAGPIVGIDQAITDLLRTRPQTPPT